MKLNFAVLPHEYGIIWFTYYDVVLLKSYVEKSERRVMRAFAVAIICDVCFWLSFIY